MLRTTTLPSILPDFAAASDLSHCDFVLRAVRRGKMTDGPSASASALANKIAFLALLPGASKMSERVFRGKQASWHVEFIGKLVSVDQAKLDAAGGEFTESVNTIQYIPLYVLYLLPDHHVRHGDTSCVWK